ncbi:hypothetical protein V1T75_16340 [Tenacibaculum sp. FZY0031]|uniref:hypothetical protein n=1 Tax=unclassified Tenacibaculum TaxID=2635139 RepID=UPI002EBD5578|nr:hypothetical protein [Tenacibaculum sp. FZY0031]
MENWYKVSRRNKSVCGNCEKSFDELGSLDHHSSYCPNCNIECIWFYFEEDKTLQVIPKYAPKEFVLFLRWAQKELDELEFLELIVSFEEIAKSLANVK